MHVEWIFAELHIFLGWPFYLYNIKQYFLSVCLSVGCFHLAVVILKLQMSGLDDHECCVSSVHTVTLIFKMTQLVRIILFIAVLPSSSDF